MAYASLRHLLRSKLTPAEFAAAIDQLHSESDRGLAILGAAWVDNAMKRALLSKMIPLGTENENNLMENKGPLAEMSARIQALYALGHIPQEFRDDLNCLKEIRNTFAHAMHALSFQTPVVLARCQQFHLRKAFKETSGRAIYTNAVMILLVSLMNVIGPGTPLLDPAPEPSPDK
jgi:hypothetical protein